MNPNAAGGQPLNPMPASLATHQTPLTPSMFTDPELEAFLDEALPAERMAAVEAELRDDASLQSRLAAIVGRRDAGVHSLGGIWRRHRLSCPPREQLGSYLLGVLDAPVEDYVEFHLTVIGCRPCQASVDDLRAQAAAADDSAASQRRSRYFQSSAGYLSGA